MVKKIAVIGGSGFYSFPELNDVETKLVSSQYSIQPVAVKCASYENKHVFFLARHGESHSIPPHKVNYRANVDVLSSLGVDAVIAVNAVGGIANTCAPGVVVLPDQIIDYTYGREHTFYDGSAALDHIDFTYPMSASLREQIKKAADSLGLSLLAEGVYGCMQGPRLETAAEIKRLQRDGCDLVGMTAMPEAALMRERELEYQSICIVANWAAGLSAEKITVEAINTLLAHKITSIRELILNFLSEY